MSSRLEAGSVGEQLRQADLLAQHDLGFFTERVFGTVSPNDIYEHNWHIDCIAEHLRACERGEIRRLIVNMPPRMLKSISISIAWPAWLLMRNSREQIMMASYTSGLIGSMTLKVREVIRSEWYQRIAAVTLAKELENWLRTTDGGQLYSTGVGGTVTGFGGRYLIVDDPLDPEQALSDVERKKANNWIGSTFLNRFNDRRTGCAVVVMQRLHSDDVTGMLEEMGGWHKLCLPGEFKERRTISMGGKVWDMAQGDVLDSRRLTPEVIAQTKREYLDPFKYEAQINQNPTPDDGMFFKKEWWQFYDADTVPKNLRKYGASDFAVSDGEGDYTVHVVVGVDPLDNWYVLECYRERVDSLTWASAQVDMMEAHKPVCWFEESGAIWRAVDPLIRKVMAERSVYTYRREVASVADKETRAQSLRGLAAMRKIYLPKNASFTTALLDELCKFPMAKHDDQVDALSLLGRMMPVIRKGEFKKELPKQAVGAITWNDAMREHTRNMRRQREG